MRETRFTTDLAGVGYRVDDSDDAKVDKSVGNIADEGICDGCCGISTTR